MCGLILFGGLARKWPAIMYEWESIEVELPKYRDRVEKKQLARQIQLTAVIVMTSALGKCKSSCVFT